MGGGGGRGGGGGGAVRGDGRKIPWLTIFNTFFNDVKMKVRMQFSVS